MWVFTIGIKTPGLDPKKLMRMLPTIIYFKIVRTWQWTQTEPPSIERRNKGKNVLDWQKKASLDETTSHASITSSQSEQGGSTKAKEERMAKRTEEVHPAGEGLQGRTKVPP
jgi:hypothetical protein